MRSKFLTTGLVIGLLVGCNGTNQNTTAISTLKSQQAPKSKITETSEFDSVSFPHKSCGEKLPNDPKAYPVKYYPVFIDYSESNLQSVKSNYCRDAFKKIRKSTGKDAIQVSSFFNRERANKFQKFMINKLGSGEVGEATVIEVKPTTEETDSPAQPQVSVGRAAKLNSEQIQKLASIVGHSKDFKNQSVVVLPTDIPEGFKVTKFLVGKQELEGLTGGHYEIVYENNSGVCFTIGGGVAIPIGNEPEDFEETQDIHTPALGSVKVGFTTSAKVGFTTSSIGNRSNLNLVAFVGSLDRISRGKNEYRFASPVRFLMTNNDNSYHWQSCKMMSRQDAKRVVQSLQFLQP